FFFSHAPPPPEIHPLSLHDALPISLAPSEQLPSLSKSYLPLPLSSACKFKPEVPQAEGMNLTTGNPVRPDTTRSMPGWHQVAHRSEEHTSELQSLTNIVCRLLLEKK